MQLDRWIARIVLPCLVLSLASLPAFSLSQTEASAIAQRVVALNDAEATRAFNALNQRGIFAVSETAGDPVREIAFRVLEASDAALNAAFNYLKTRGVFDALVSPGLSPADRIALEEVRSAAAACEQELDRINPLVDEYNASWIPGRLRIRKLIGRTIEQARAYLQRAQGRFSPLSARTEPEVKAVGEFVERARKEFNEYIEWWNREFASNG
jgi:hypothetical protein